MKKNYSKADEKLDDRKTQNLVNKLTKADVQKRIKDISLICKEDNPETSQLANSIAKTEVCLKNWPELTNYYDAVINGYNLTDLRGRVREKLVDMGYNQMLINYS